MIGQLSDFPQKNSLKLSEKDDVVPGLPNRSVTLGG